MEFGLPGAEGRMNYP